MLKAELSSRKFIFNFPAGTSKGVLHHKHSHFIKISDSGNTGAAGIGECSLIPNISPDNLSTYQSKLNEVVDGINVNKNTEDINFKEHPSIAFGLQTALLDYNNGGNKILYPSNFTEGCKGIKINGLVWMGNKDFMLKQIKDKIDKNFSCIKIKVGAINFDAELEILQNIRKVFSVANLEIRLDANGAFTPEDALSKLNKLAAINIHSIEQPIKPGQVNHMQKLCASTPIPIALDEELLTASSQEDQQILLEQIKPHIIILKPSLLGGFNNAQQWINKAQELNINWWLTSALESNIGLNAIAQWAYKVAPNKIHGLGTGQIYNNNIQSPLFLIKDTLWHATNNAWDNSI